MLSDQFTSPTYVPNLSKMLIEISERHLDWNYFMLQVQQKYQGMKWLEWYQIN